MISVNELTHVQSAARAPGKAAVTARATRYTAFSTPAAARRPARRPERSSSLVSRYHRFISQAESFQLLVFHQQHGRSVVLTDPVSRHYRATSGNTLAQTQHHPGITTHSRSKLRTQLRLPSMIVESDRHRSARIDSHGLVLL